MEEHGEQEGPAPPAIPIWLTLAAVCLLDTDRFGPADPGAAALAHLSAARAAPAEPERAPARLLRALPGIGVRRAADLVDLRWRRGGRVPLEAWTQVPGIGPRTVAGVRAALGRPRGPVPHVTPAFAPDPRGGGRAGTGPPGADGVRIDGPETQGPEAEGPRADGPRADGPRADGPRADGP